MAGSYNGHSPYSAAPYIADGNIMFTFMVSGAKYLLYSTGVVVWISAVGQIAAWKS